MKFKLPDLKKMSKREKTGAVAAIVVVALVLAYHGAITPWVKYSTKLHKEISKLEKSAATGKLLLSRELAIRQDLERYSKYLRKEEAPEKEIASFLKEIENMAGQSQVSLLEVRPLETEEQEWYKEYALEVNYTAEMVDWMKFVYMVESNPALLTIDRATVGLENEKSKRLKGSMRIKRLIVLDQPGTQQGAST